MVLKRPTTLRVRCPLLPAKSENRTTNQFAVGVMVESIPRVTSNIHVKFDSSKRKLLDELEGDKGKALN